MVIFAAFFALGVWLLQQQAALPDFAWAWLLLVFPLLYPLSRQRERARVRGVNRESNFQHLIVRSMCFLSFATFACCAGFYHAAWQAEQHLAASLPDEWQGRDIEVIGVVAELPRHHERGLRFNFDVEQTVTPQASVPNGHGEYATSNDETRHARLPHPNHPPLAGNPHPIPLPRGEGTIALSPFGGKMDRGMGTNERLREFHIRRIYLSTYYDRQAKPLYLKAGERWRLTLRLKQPHGVSNPHGFDFEIWALERNIRAVGYVHNKGDNRRIDQLADGMGYRIETWRERVRDKFEATLGEAPYAGVLSALAIGDQNSISAQQWQVFTRTGVNHLMSISGLHITMLASIAFAIAYWLWRRSIYLTLRMPARKAAALAALLVALGYALLSGFAVPAQRTVYMVGAVTVALWLNRNFSPWQIMGIALLGVLIPDPWAVMSAGFWLSFGAVALILYVSAYRIRGSPWLQEGKAVAYPLRVIGEYASVQWAMAIGLIPLLLGLFQQVSLVSPLANAIAIPMVSLVVVPLALLGAVLPLDAPLWLAHIVMDGVMHFLEWLNALPQAVWTQHAPPAWSIGAGMSGVLWILLPRGFPARWLGFLLLLPMFLNRPEPPAQDTLRLIVFDVGQGLAVAAQTRQHALLFDTGPDFSGEADSGNRILIPSLRALGIAELDGLILSHDDIDHTGGAATIMQAIPIGWVASSLPAMHPLDRESRRCRDGMSWNWDGVQFEMLNPPSDSSAKKAHGSSAKKAHDNDLSCVLRISTGRHSILLTGDIGKNAEKRLIRQHADKLFTGLLVVPHHGSNNSSSEEFIAATLPDYAVFTAGYRNRFGHPREEVLQRYADSGAELLRSDEDGAILVEMNAEGIKVESYRKAHQRYWMHR